MSAVATPTAPASVPAPPPAAGLIERDRLVVTVTARDIEEGRRRSPFTCAIALAAGRRLEPARQYAEMDADGVLRVHTERPGGDDVTTLRYFNEYAGAWVRKFDRNKRSVTPERFVFRLIQS